MFGQSDRRMVSTVLSKQNYKLWLVTIKDVLIGNGLDSYVDKTYLKTVPKSELNGIEIESPRTEFDCAAYEPDKQNQHKGMFYIRSSVPESVQELIADARTIKEMLDIIKATHSKKENLYNLNAELTTIQWNRQTAEEYLTKIKDLRNRMNNIKKQDDSLFVTKIIDEMPGLMSTVQDRYRVNIEEKEEYIQSLNFETFCENMITYYNQALRDKERRQSKKNADMLSGDEAYFMARKCEKCGGLDHNKYHCPHNPPQTKKRQRYRRRGNAGGGQNGGQNNQCGQNGNQQSNSNQNQSSQNANSSSRDSNNSNRQSGQQTNRNAGGQSNSSGGQNRNRGQRGQRSGELSEYEDAAMCMSEQLKGTKPDAFYLDNCSHRHIVNRLNYFETYSPFEEVKVLKGAGMCWALGMGTVRMESMIRDKPRIITLSNVYYVQGFPTNLISQSAIEDQGARPTLGETSTHLYQNWYCKKKIPLFTCRRLLNSPQFYEIRIQFAPQECFLMDVQWHSNLGHTNYAYLDKTKDCVTGMVMKKTDARKDTCITCAETKSTARTFNHKLCKSTTPGEVVHTDICDEPVRSIGGDKYMIVFVDECTRYKRVYFVKNPDAEQVGRAIEKYFAELNAQIKSTPERPLPARLHSDKGGAYTSELVQKLLLRSKCAFSCAQTGYHQQNGLAEKSIQDIQGMARAMLKSSNSPDCLWAEAANNAVYVQNRTYKRSVSKTPYEALTGTKPNLAHIRPFGVLAMLHLPPKTRNKLNVRSIVMKLVGHTEQSVNYRLVDRNYKKVVVETNIQFIKNSNTANGGIVAFPDFDRMAKGELDVFDRYDDDRDRGDRSDGESDRMANLQHAHENELQTEPADQQSNAEPKKNQWPQLGADLTDAEQNVQPKAPIEYFQKIVDAGQTVNDSDVYDFLIDADDVIIPSTIQEMLQNKYKELWLEAMDQEFLAFIANKCISLVPDQPNTKKLRGRWIFSIKKDDKGKVLRFKARYVIDGSRIEESIYAPVIAQPMNRAFAALAMTYGWIIHLVDIKNAFLRAPRNSDQPIYIKQIPMYEDTSRPDYVFKVEGSIYGLPESAYNWFNELRSYLLEIGMRQSLIEPCLFYVPVQTGELMFILVHVDDMQLISNLLTTIEKYKKLILDKFDLTDKGLVRNCLGVEYNYSANRKTLYLSQRAKIKDLAKWLQSELPKPTKLPIPRDSNLFGDEQPYADPHRYMQIIGHLNYLAISTRPDILFYVNQLSRFLKNPNKQHYYLALKLVSWLNESQMRALKFQDYGKSKNVQVYVDASLFEIQKLKKATTGVAVKFNGNLIAWMTKRQGAITDNVCEAEIYAANAGTRQGLYYRNVIGEIGVLENCFQRIDIYCDNLSANRINTEGLTVNVKHLSLSLQYVRTKMADGVLALKGVNSADNCADIFTKFVDHKTFDRQLDILNLRETKRKKEPGKSEDGSGSSASGESAALVEMAPSGGLSLDIDK